MRHASKPLGSMAGGYEGRVARSLRVVTGSPGLAALFALFSSVSSAFAQTADLVFINGNIITVDEQKPRAEAESKPSGRRICSKSSRLPWSTKVHMAPLR